jgi:arylsulfatase A-like enzyme
MMEVPDRPGTTDEVHPANETIPAEMFNTTIVRMDDWKGIHRASDKLGVWHLYNIATELGENTDVADQYPEILKKLFAAYDQYAQDVGVIIPTPGSFATLFPPITANDTQTIDPARMLALGSPLKKPNRVRFHQPRRLINIRAARE